MVHMTKLPANMLLVRIEVPDTLPLEEINSLPADPKAFQQLGDEWLQHNGSAVLRVPSVLVPRQWNLLLNPEHPLFAAIQIIDQAPFAFDSRLLSAFPTA
jgi:RES domain-containing protein